VEQWVTQWGYLGIFAAMVLENVIPPIPSELIMPLAASACLGQGQVEFRLCSVSLHARGTEEAMSSLALTVVFKQQLDQIIRLTSHFMRLSSTIIVSLSIIQSSLYCKAEALRTRACGWSALPNVRCVLSPILRHRLA
jgi:hypothetical protein